MSSDGTQRKSSLLKLRVSALEADLAYFAARLELIGEPVTSHQRAQIKAYRALEKALESILKRLHTSARRNGDNPNRGAIRR
jgi:cell division septum initiation protein DivIVA